MNDDRQAGRKEIGGGGEWTALREALGEIKELLGPDSPYVVKRSDNKNIDLSEVMRIGGIFERADEALERREALAAAAPAPPDCPVKGISCDAPCKDYPRCAAQDGQGAELPSFTVTTGALPRNSPPSWAKPEVQFLGITDAERKAYEKETAALGPPRGGSSSDLAGSDSLSVAERQTGMMKWFDAYQNQVKLTQQLLNAQRLAMKFDVEQVWNLLDESTALDNASPTDVTGGTFDVKRLTDSLNRIVLGSLPEAVAGNASAPVGEQQEQHLDSWDEPHTVKMPVGERVKAVLLDIADTLNGGEYKGVITHAILPAVLGVIAGQPSGVGEPRTEHELQVGGIVRAALELAILRGDLRMDNGAAFEEMSESEREDVITDTWNAMNGEGTCDDEPVKELTAIYAALAAREVGEGLREAADEINQCLQIIVTNAGNLPTGQVVFPNEAKEQVQCIAEIYKAVERASKVTWAALAAPAPKPASDEYVKAVALANRVLDRSSGDPDDDLAVLARQFLRSNGLI